MKLILVLAAVTAWASLGNSRRKVFYQHHRGVIERRRSTSAQPSIDGLTKMVKQQQFQDKSSARRPHWHLVDITGTEIIDELLGSYGLN